MTGASGGQVLAGRPDRRLGRPVHVPRVGGARRQRPGQPGRQRLAAAQRPQPGQRGACAGGPVGGQQLPGRGGGLHDGGPAAGDLARQQPRGAGGLAVGHDDLGPGRQREEQFQPGDVEAEGSDREQGVGGGEAGAFGHGGQQVGEVALRHLHALGDAGRPGGVDEVGHLVRDDAVLVVLVVAVVPVVLVVGGLLGRVAEPQRGRGREAGGGRPVGDHEAGPAVGQHEGEPVGRVGRVQRQVGGARLPGRQHRDQHVRAAFEAQPDDCLGAGAPGAEPRCEPTRPRGAPFLAGDVLRMRRSRQQGSEAGSDTDLKAEIHDHPPIITTRDSVISIEPEPAGSPCPRWTPKAPRRCRRR